MAATVADVGAHHEPDEACIEAEISRALHPFLKRPGNVNVLRERLTGVMWDDVGITRTAQGIQKAIDQLQEFKTEVLETGVGDLNTVFNVTWHDWLNLRNLAEISEVIAQAALSRENSRGAHYREDFPESGDLDESYFIVARSRNGRTDVCREPVIFSIVKPGDSLVENYEEATPQTKR